MTLCGLIPAFSHLYKTFTANVKTGTKGRKKSINYEQSELNERERKPAAAPSAFTLRCVAAQQLVRSDLCARHKSNHPQLSARAASSKHLFGVWCYTCKHHLLAAQRVRKRPAAGWPCRGNPFQHPPHPQRD